MVPALNTPLHVNGCELAVLNWTVFSIQAAEIKYYYFSSPARHNIHLLKFCFAPSAKCPSKHRFYARIQKVIWL